MRLKNKIALISGASSGIGRSTAKLFAREGAKIVVNYFSSKKQAESVANEIKKIGSEALLVKCDVSKPSQVKSMVQQVLGKFNSIDILVNNAGVLLPKSFDEITDANWQKTMNTNLLGTYNCIRVVSRQMKKQKSGKIINLSSIASIVGSLSSLPYSISKAGIDAITKTLAPELGKYNIQINSVAPGPVKTDLLVKNYSQEVIKKLAKETPLGRIAKPDDIARAILFFASQDSDYITGQTLIVDGGRIRR